MSNLDKALNDKKTFATFSRHTKEPVIGIDISEHGSRHIKILIPDSVWERSNSEERIHLEHCTYYDIDENGEQLSCQSECVISRNVEKGYRTVMILLEG